MNEYLSKIEEECIAKAETYAERKVEGELAARRLFLVPAASWRSRRRSKSAASQ